MSLQGHRTIAMTLLGLTLTSRRAPEFPFPRGLDDAWEALLWVRLKTEQRILKRFKTNAVGYR